MAMKGECVQMDNGTLAEGIWTLHDLQKKMVNEGGAPDEWFMGWFEWVPS